MNNKKIALNNKHRELMLYIPQYLVAIITIWLQVNTLINRVMINP